MKKLYLSRVFAIALLVFFAGCSEDAIISEENKIFANSSTNIGEFEGGSGIADGVIYELPEVGGSGIFGTVTITDLDEDGSHIFVDLNNTDRNTEYPLHIHLGPAAGGGPVIVTLNNVDGATGTSTTIVTHREDDGTLFDYDQLTGIDEYYIAAHRSTHTGDVVARGNVGAAEPMPFPCEGCGGDVSNLTMEYFGIDDVNVEVRQQIDNELVYSNTVSNGEQFSFFGATFNADGNLFGQFIELFVNGNSIGRIDTTCDVSIGPGLILGNFEISTGFSTLVHGPLCPFEEFRECTECDGKATQLRLQYNGDQDAMVRVVQQKGEVVYNGLVSPNQIITFNGVDKKNTLSPKISIFVDNVLNTEIHTSCSVPLGPGLVSGSFTVVSGESRNGDGPLCPVEANDNPSGDCNECDGKVTQLTLQFGEHDGGVDIGYLRVTGKNGDGVYFDGNLNPGQTFVLNPLNGEDTLDKSLEFYYDGNLIGKLHTSCSEPIGPGITIGDFMIIEGFSRNGGLLCPAENDDDDDETPTDCDECDGKVTTLTLRYEGTGSANVRIVQKKNDIIVFDDNVSVNQLITIVGQDNKGTLSSEIKIYINGELTNRIHTSCSDPIGPGQEYGVFEIISGSSRNGGELCRIQPSNGGVYIP